MGCIYKFFLPNDIHYRWCRNIQNDNLANYSPNNQKDKAVLLTHDT